MERVKKEIQPVQITGEIGDCVFTHHRIVHSAGSNTGATIRMGVFSDYQKVRPSAPIVFFYRFMLLFYRFMLLLCYK